jgi:hypothetical protein
MSVYILEIYNGKEKIAEVRKTRNDIEYFEHNRIKTDIEIMIGEKSVMDSSCEK